VDVRIARRKAEAIFVGKRRVIRTQRGRTHERRLNETQNPAGMCRRPRADGCNRGNQIGDSNSRVLKITLKTIYDRVINFTIK